MQPTLPEPLRPLAILASNLRWSWHEETKNLFRAVDPELWATCRHDPIKLLSRVPSPRLQQLARDKKFVRHLELLVADLDEYMTGDLWYQGFAANHPDAPAAIGYFSAEFGISEVLPQYSGGLGILAGDHLKAASDQGVPIIGVGLLYRHGYFRQSLNASGWQQERYPVLDPNEMPISQLKDADGTPVEIEVTLSGTPVSARVWLAQVGRVPLLMLDTDLESNGPNERLITDRLYGGGADHRLAQEMLLGIGGVRALRAYCKITGHREPEVFHCNEGHAGFLGLERLREYVEAGQDLDTAIENTRAGTVFTTHTPVPAGIDRFDAQKVREQFADFPLPIDRIMSFGQEDYPGGDPSRFNMAVLGFRLGQRANGVSELHGEVSREMFNPLWPDFDASEVPITSVTNGVHHRTWIHPELMELLEARTGDSESVIDGCDWKALDRIDDTTLWTLKRQMRASMITMARERLTESCSGRGINPDWVATALDPHTLTFGFARRGASYKRLTLMLSDPDRLKALLNHPTTPIQIVIAGKAHPADDIGKSLIQTMVQFADQEDVRGKIVFLPDYDISLARPLYPGCDVWMNNPLRPQEACGTSGMKAALNGAANLSIRDGWWDEWYDPAWGWEITSAEGVTDPVARDRLEAEAMYDIIEREIIPKFYNRDAMGIPTAWVQLIRDTIQGLGPRLLASRMVQDYVTRMYTPAVASSHALAVGTTAQELASWKKRIHQAWPKVGVARLESHFTGTVEVGVPMEFAAWVDMDGLDRTDVQVQLIAGDVDELDQLHDLKIYLLDPDPDTAPDGSTVRFVKLVPANYPGSRGYTVRVVPNNRLLASDAEMGLAAVPQRDN